MIEYPYPMTVVLDDNAPPNICESCGDTVTEGDYNWRITPLPDGGGTAEMAFTHAPRCTDAFAREHFGEGGWYTRKLYFERESASPRRPGVYHDVTPERREIDS